ncbi:hypothetical protein L1987_09504 [Smallanthus sonchifolius]|uniref:Uncharacterized protein n=1 Tax=Smallanthus sonchifolius TaxID=185202 RepID=A0ACB9JPP6_9ASTR|nr:hypothetical protein L1987_09504 [Smallanthus sonchifolius]
MAGSRTISEHIQFHRRRSRRCRRSSFRTRDWVLVELRQSDINIGLIELHLRPNYNSIESCGKLRNQVTFSSWETNNLDTSLLEDR